MTSYNEITGHPLRTKAATSTYRDNYDAIFGKKKEAEPVKTETTEVAETKTEKAE